MLFDATGSYDIPFHINGALLWSGALIMGFVIKYSGWKERGENMEARMPSNNITFEDGGDISVYGDGEEEPVSTRYQPVPSSRELDSSA